MHVHACVTHVHVLFVILHVGVIKITYDTAQLQLHFYTRGHAWHHAVFCVDGARFLRGKLICHESIRGISTG